MEELARWIASCCDEVLEICDRGDATLSSALASNGVRVIGTDPERGLDPDFALATYHPKNVVGRNLDDAAVLAVLNAVCVERFFHAPPFDADWPAGWKAVIRESGLMLERTDEPS